MRMHETFSAFTQAFEPLFLGLYIMRALS